MIVRRLVRAIDTRLRVAPVGRKALAKVFPDHWSFMLGEIALYCLVVLILTGVFLTFFFEPSTAETVYRGRYEPLDGVRVSAAYASTVALSFDVPAGLLMRQTHHWAALVFVGAIVAHLLRIFFTGAFRHPREINWLVGVTMLALALLNGFTGYSMPDDLLSGTGLRIIHSVVLSVPVLGSWLVFLLFGGEFPAPETIPRMFVSHVLLVPALLVGLVALHMAILVRQKHSQFPGPGRGGHNVVGSRLWPSYTMRTLALFGYVLGVLFLLGGLVQINPVWLYGPFHPSQVTTPAQPDWYVAWGEGALRLFPPVEFEVFGYLVPSPFLPGAALGGLTFLVLYAWPFLEARAARKHRGRTAAGQSDQLLDRPREHPVRMGIGVGALVLYTLLVVAAGDDIVARLLDVPLSDVVLVLRVLVLGLPLLAGVVAFLLARSLRAGTAESFGELTRADLRAGVRRGSGVDGDDDEQPAPASERVEIWQTAERRWRWRYADHASQTYLTSNEDFASPEEAARSAHTAYPPLPAEGVPWSAIPDEPGPPARPGLLAAGAWMILYLLGRRHRR